MPSRRALLAGVGLAATSLAGCVTDLTDSASAERAVALSTDRLGHPDGFEREAAASRETYGDLGLWGRSAGPSLAPDVEYLGAWTDTWGVPPAPERDGERPFAEADAAALAYRVGERRRVWLWLAARTRQASDRLGRTNLSRLRVETEPGEGWELIAAAPRSPTRERAVEVALDERGPSATVPLPGGGVAADTFELGRDGRVEVAWQGISADPRAVHAVAEYAPVADRGAASDPFAPPVSFGVGAARGVF